jgi:hypothetical protein
MRSSELHTRMGLMLILLQEYSVIPELWEFFNTRPEDANDSDEFLRFLSTFGGFVLNVPDPEKMNRILKSIHVYHLIEGAEDQRRGAREAASFYDASDEEIIRLYRRIKEKIEKHKDKLAGQPPTRLRKFKGSRASAAQKKRSQEAADRAVKSQCQVDEND